MAKISLPSNPVDGQKVTVGSRVYVYDADTSRWNARVLQVLGKMPVDVTINQPNVDISANTLFLDAVGQNYFIKYDFDRDADVSFETENIEDATVSISKSNNTIVIQGGTVDFDNGIVRLIVRNGRRQSIKTISLSAGYPDVLVNSTSPTIHSEFEVTDEYSEKNSSTDGYYAVDVNPNAANTELGILGKVYALYSADNNVGGAETYNLYSNGHLDLVYRDTNSNWSDGPGSGVSTPTNFKVNTTHNTLYYAYTGQEGATYVMTLGLGENDYLDFNSRTTGSRSSSGAVPAWWNFTDDGYLVGAAGGQRAVVHYINPTNGGFNDSSLYMHVGIGFWGNLGNQRGSIWVESVNTIYIISSNTFRAIEVTSRSPTSASLSNRGDAYTQSGLQKVVVDGDYVYCASNGSVKVMEVTAPTTWTEVASITIPTSTYLDMTYAEGFLYVVTDETIGVYDVRDLNNITTKGQTTGLTGLYANKLSTRGPTTQTLKYLGGHLILVTSWQVPQEHRVITIR